MGNEIKIFKERVRRNIGDGRIIKSMVKKLYYLLELVKEKREIQ